MSKIRYIFYCIGGEIKMIKKILNKGIVINIFIVMTLTMTLSIIGIPSTKGYAAISGSIISIFPDTNLASAVASAAGKSSVNDNITQNQMDGITNLFAINKNINDISGIGYLTNLQQLDLSHNNLTIIPTELANLTNMTYLSLSHNVITTIPLGIMSKLSKLQIIQLGENKIDDLSELYDLPLTCVKYCDNQTIIIHINSPFEANQSAYQRIDLPQIYLNNNATIAIGNAIINTDKKSINVPLNIIGNNKVKVNIDGGIAPNSSIEINYIVKDTTPPGPPVIDVSLNNLTAASLKPTTSHKTTLFLSL